MQAQRSFLPCLRLEIAYDQKNRGRTAHLSVVPLLLAEGQIPAEVQQVLREGHLRDAAEMLIQRKRDQVFILLARKDIQEIARFITTESVPAGETSWPHNPQSGAVRSHTFQRWPGTCSDSSGILLFEPGST
jgi:hypothetical protein